MSDTRTTIVGPRFSRGCAKKLDALSDAINSMKKSGVLDTDELLRLASEVKKEAAEPNFLQEEKRKAGAIHARAAHAPTGMING